MVACALLKGREASMTIVAAVTATTGRCDANDVARMPPATRAGSGRGVPVPLVVVDVVVKVAEVVALPVVVVLPEGGAAVERTNWSEMDEIPKAVVTVGMISASCSSSDEIVASILKLELHAPITKVGN